MDGHALTLQIIGQFLVRAFHGDIRRCDRIDLQKADAKVQAGHAFRAMEAYVKWMEDESEEARRELALLKLLGLFDRPATADCVAALRQAPAIPGLTEPLVGLAEDDWEFSLTSLRDAKLLTVNREEGSGEFISLDAHPLLREYFAQRVRQQQPEAWRVAHRRLYEHLCATTKEGEQPTLEELQPLYQAVAHGCLANLSEQTFMEVYWSRISRRETFYATTALGAIESCISALRAFGNASLTEFNEGLTSWSRGWILSELGYHLKTAARLGEAEQMLMAARTLRENQKNWKDAARDAGTLSDTIRIQGRILEAVEIAKQAPRLADRSKDVRQMTVRRVTLAVALHQAGLVDKALSYFLQACELATFRCKKAKAV